MKMALWSLFVFELCLCIFKIRGFGMVLDVR